MNIRLFAVLFSAFFLIGIFPIFFIQSFGSASAGVSAGFIAVADNIYHVAISIAIGVISIFLGNEVLLVFPLSLLLMLATGALTQIQEAVYPGIHAFIGGAILLFTLNVSILRRRALLLGILPIAVWAYFAGGNYMQAIPPITTPLFFIIGIITCTTLILAIGVALGMTLMSSIEAGVEKFKNLPAFATFFSLF